MNSEQIELLGEYIKARKSPILLEEVPNNIAEKGAIVIEADNPNLDLNGQFDEFDYVEPEWYQKLMESSKKHTPVLVIKNINNLPETEQRKFIELVKYKKAYINQLPENCMVFMTYNDLDKNPIDKELYSYMIHI